MTSNAFYRKNVNYFPRGLEKHFPNLTQVVIHSCGIKEILRSDLKGLEGLIGLRIVNCQLTSLPDDLFTEMPNLRDISFQCNKIEFASSELLKPLLRRDNVRVSLKANKNIDAYFDAIYERRGSLESLEGLMKLIDEKCIKPARPTFPDHDEFIASVDLKESRSNIALKIDASESIEELTKLSDEKSTEPVLPAVPELLEFIPRIKEMWLSGKFSDLTIIGGGKKFKVHKTILGMRSEVFAQFFEDQTKAIGIKIADFSLNSVEALLKFIYTNEISRDGNAKENFQIADKFKVLEMKTIYEKMVCEQVDESNALETFLFAHRFSSQLLKEKAFRLIVKKIPGELPEELMEDPESLKKLIDARGHYEEILTKLKLEH